MRTEGKTEGVAWSLCFLPALFHPASSILSNHAKDGRPFGWVYQSDLSSHAIDGTMIVIIKTSIATFPVLFRYYEEIKTDRRRIRVARITTLGEIALEYSTR